VIHCSSALVVAASLAFLAGCYQAPFDYELYDDTPIVKVEIYYLPASEDALNKIVHEFADTNGYEARVARIHPDELDFSIMLWRPDSMLFGSTPFQYDLYRFGVYAAKENPIPAEAAKKLADDLLAKFEGN